MDRFQRAVKLDEKAVPIVLIWCRGSGEFRLRTEAGDVPPGILAQVVNALHERATPTCRQSQQFTI